MKARSIIPLLLALLSCLGGPPRACGEEVRVERSRPMMGTMVEITVLGTQRGMKLVSRLPGAEAIIVAEEGPGGRQLAPHLSKGLQGRVSLSF